MTCVFDILLCDKRDTEMLVYVVPYGVEASHDVSSICQRKRSKYERVPFDTSAGSSVRVRPSAWRNPVRQPGASAHAATSHPIAP